MASTDRVVFPRPLNRSLRGVGGFDLAVDRTFQRHLRDRPVVDRVMYGASAVGDHGILWFAIAGLQQVRRRRAGVASWRPFVRTTAGIGIESALVNGPVKWMFRRDRPAVDAARPLRLRQPRTSSFPSGHATSAFCAAALLRDGDPWWPLYYCAAVVVALSRVHVRIHHGSDVAGGIILGIALGEVARYLVPLTKASVATSTMLSPARTVNLDLRSSGSRRSNARLGNPESAAE
ncbi:MAG TPA: phosphatase PAP2 family protein [Acidimicrobiales bacterium]|nr:phosphatase PAP2 family protein [Acidimicrobiales bacterium]